MAKKKKKALLNTEVFAEVLGEMDITTSLEKYIGKHLEYAMDEVDAFETSHALGKCIDAAVKKHIAPLVDDYIKTNSDKLVKELIKKRMK